MFDFIIFRSCNSENDLRERTSFSIAFTFTTWTYRSTSSRREWCINTCYYVTTRTASTTATTTSSSYGKIIDIQSYLLISYFLAYRLSSIVIQWTLWSSNSISRCKCIWTLSNRYIILSFTFIL
jgi:hypothetical protein